MSANTTMATVNSDATEADVIAGIWAQALGCEVCARDVNFFELGGTSLMMMRIHADIQRQLKCDVSIVELFAHPTIKSLAERLTQLRSSSQSPEIVFPTQAKARPMAQAFRPMKPRR